MTDVMTTTEEDQQPGVLLRPGALAGDVSVDIHTLQAFMLVKVLPAGQTKIFFMFKLLVFPILSGYRQTIWETQGV